ERDQIALRGAEALGDVRALYQEQKLREDDDERMFAELQSLRPYPLAPAERFVARQMRREGHTAAEVATALGPTQMASLVPANATAPPWERASLQSEIMAALTWARVAAWSNGWPRPGVGLAAELAALHDLEPVDFEP